MNPQPEALYIANSLEAYPDALAKAASAELRRLHALNTELLKALKNLYTVTHHLGACPGTVEKARAAIAKAEAQ